MTHHRSSDRMGFRTAACGVWALGQGLTSMFVPDCEDVLGGGGLHSMG